ncbi:hypothetical protein JXB28_01960 [Candidatus Woesearchaeota archaeon]|nr:hypothetical protein [Candidatus Woesearchaeota archaeon]
MELSIKRGFLLLVLAILGLSMNLIPQASALGVSPSRVTMNFEPNYEYETDVCFSTQGITRLKVEAIGELAPYITITGPDENGEIQAEINNCVHYKLKLPSSFDTPGRKDGGVTALELSDETYGNVQALVRIHHQIWVYVPYPGKYLEITSFKAGNVKAGGTVPFIIDIISKGDETIEEASGKVYIYKNNNQIGVVDTNVARKLELDQPRQLSAKWDSTGYKEGNYEAFVEISYDGLDANETTPFKLGALDANLINYTRELIVGGIKEFHATVDSIWDETLQGVRVVAKVYNYSQSKEQPVASVETLTRNLDPWSTEDLKGFLDISTFNIGTYDIELTLYFSEIGSAKEMTKEYTDKLSIVPEPPKPKEKKPSIFTRFASAKLSTKLIIGGLLLMLILSIAFLVYILLPKKKRDAKADKQPAQEAKKKK